MNASVLLATTGSGIHRAERESNGAWRAEVVLNGEDVRCLAADPRKSAVVYAGTQGHGLYRSADRGQTWEPCGMDGQVVKAVAPSPTVDGLIFAGTKPAYLYASHDGGATWAEYESFRRIPGRKLWFSPAEAPFVAYVQGIAPSPADASVLVVGIEAGAVVRSADGGVSWTGHRDGAVRDCHSLAFHVSDGAWVYEGGGGGAAVSRNGGETWEQPKDTPAFDRHYCWAVAADPADPEIWYVSASPSAFKAHGKDAQAYIYRRQDGRWHRLEGGLPTPLVHMPYALVTDPDAPGHVYAGLSNGDVWHSADYGETWAQLAISLNAVRRSMLVLF